mmetsp:Transcript_11268/g.32902  ORF Transcript_11268/g.32902 Transcript_11268/m.32902 type:complete len:86 (+) Transcript_11268:297-554(+)
MLHAQSPSRRALTFFSGLLAATLVPDATIFTFGIIWRTSSSSVIARISSAWRVVALKAGLQNIPVLCRAAFPFFWFPGVSFTRNL